MYYSNKIKLQYAVFVVMVNIQKSHHYTFLNLGVYRQYFGQRRGAYLVCQIATPTLQRDEGTVGQFGWAFAKTKRTMSVFFENKKIKINLSTLPKTLWKNHKKIGEWRCYVSSQAVSSCVITGNVFLFWDVCANVVILARKTLLTNDHFNVADVEPLWQYTKFLATWLETI